MIWSRRFDIAHFKLIYISKLLAIFNKYSRALKIWGTFPFFSQNFHDEFEAKNLSPVVFHALTYIEFSVSINVLTGVKRLPRYFRWHALTTLTSIHGLLARTALHTLQCVPPEIPRQPFYSSQNIGSTHWLLHMSVHEMQQVTGF